MSNAVGSAYSVINLNIEWPPKFVDNEDDNSRIENFGDVNDNSGGDIENPGSKSNDSITKTKNSDLRLNVSQNTAKNNNSTSDTNHKDKTESTENDSDGSKKNDKSSYINSFKTEISNATVGALSDRAVNISTTNNKVVTNDINEKNTKIFNETKNVHRKGKYYDRGIQVHEVVEGDDTYLDCSVDAKPIAKVRTAKNSWAFYHLSRLNPRNFYDLKILKSCLLI